MFGTDLESAYYDSGHNSYASREQHQVENNDSITTGPAQEQPTVNIADVIQQQQQPSSSSQVTSYDVHNPRIIPLYEQQVKNSNTIKELQLELLKQKQQSIGAQGANQEPLYDRYLSKKKDVFKLLNIALTVLFAISMHFVLGDLIKSYLRNNDFSYNKETVIKFAYPMSVLVLLWSMKVFNK